MPYDVYGWIEVLWDVSLEEEEQKWCSLINLSRFYLPGDDVTDLLFGLAKMPSENAYFANRGIPKDCSSYIANEMEENRKFIEKYGEGDFGHTYALWSEISEILLEVEDLPGLREDLHSDWHLIFSVVKELCKQRFKPEWIRFVVWANW